MSDPRDPATKERLLTRNSWNRWREYNLLDKRESEDNVEWQRVFSKEVQLNKNQYYYFETSAWNLRGPFHLTVGFEVKPNKMPIDHPNLETSVQQFSVGQKDFKFDQL